MINHFNIIYLFISQTFFLLFNSCNAQMYVDFLWPGPLVVPVDNTVVEQGKFTLTFIRGLGGGE